MDNKKIAQELVNLAKAVSAVSQDDIEEGRYTFHNVGEVLDALQTPWDRHWVYGSTGEEPFQEMQEFAAKLRNQAKALKHEYDENMHRWREMAKKAQRKPVREPQW